MGNPFAEAFRQLVTYVWVPVCSICSVKISRPELGCVFCLSECEPTGFQQKPTANPAFFRLTGCENITAAASGFFYEKGSTFQKIIYSVKYHRNPQTGVALGNFLGYFLKDCAFLTEAEAIFPVSMHVKKLRRKGYNHSERIAFGLSQRFKIPVMENVLVKKVLTGSQTRLNASERFHNLKDTIEINPSNGLKWKNKPVILFDDVLTTGSTLKTCLFILEKAGFADVRVLTAGITRSA